MRINESLNSLLIRVRIDTHFPLKCRFKSWFRSLATTESNDAPSTKRFIDDFIVSLELKGRISILKRSEIIAFEVFTQKTNYRQ